MLSAVTLEIEITNLTGGLTYEFKVQITYIVITMGLNLQCMQFIIYAGAC